MLNAILVGLAVFYSVELIRALPGVRTWVQNATKPWACHVCMSGWIAIIWTIALTVGAHWFTGATPWVVAPASAGVSLILLHAVSAMSGVAGPEIDLGPVQTTSLPGDA